MAARRPTRCALRCRAGALLLCLPVGHRAPIGDLGLASKLALCLAHGLVRGPDPGLHLALRGAGGELESTDLLARQGGLRVGVVLLAREQAPKQAGELARGGDDRDLLSERVIECNEWSCLVRYVATKRRVLPSG